jgi:hypothetical protein
MRLKRSFAIAFLTCVALVVPAAASAHHGGGDRWHHHHHFVALKGTVVSANQADHTLVVDVTRANRKANALEGKRVTVHAVGGWVADTNNDGKHNLADVKDGDTVIVFTKRRFINFDALTISKAKVWDKTNSGSAAFRSGDHHCDGDRR